MKNQLFTASCLILLALPIHAAAAEKYVSLSAGTWLPAKTTYTDNNFRLADMDYNAGMAVGGACGITLDSGMRLETELVYRQAKARAVGGAWVFGWLVNAWWDFRNSSVATPYVGGGVGFGGGHEASPGPVDNTEGGVVYQAGAGIDFRLNKQFSLDLGYRYFGMTGFGTNGGVGSVNMSGSSVMLGVRYRFESTTHD